jgi:colanic acid/amylovoran biosynthesis glycosyltransferase
MKRVLIYRTELLPLSETFIRAQTSSLRPYQPSFVGQRSTRPTLLSSGSMTLAEQSCRLPHAAVCAAYDWVGVHPLLHRTSFLHALSSLRASLMHAHFATDAIAAAPLARALGVPLVVTLHGYDVTADLRGRNRVRNWLRHQRMRALHEQAELFLCVSDFIRKKALAAGFPAHKLIVHHIGVDTEIFCPSPASSSTRQIVFVGRLTEKKGCAHLIEAMAGVRRTVPTAELLILGDGPLRLSLEYLALRLGIPCKFLGVQSQDAVRRHLGCARICVVPSITASNGDSEGLPMIVAEAQAMGVPVVGTRHAGIPEGIVDGFRGMLSEEGDVHGLARNIARLLNDEDLHADLRLRGIQFVRDRFNLRKQTLALESIYDAVASD